MLPPETLRENQLVPCLSQPPESTSHALVFLSRRCIILVSASVFLSSSCVSNLSLPLLPWLVRLSWITWDNLRISKSLMYSHLPRPLVQSLGMTEKLTFGSYYQAYLTYVQFLHILVASHWIFTRSTSRILAFISFWGVVCFKSLLF